MTLEQVLAFADALPPLPRGIFIQGSRPADPIPLASVEQFMQEIIEDLSAHHVPPQSIAEDVFPVLSEHTDPREAMTMRAQLPEPLMPL